MCSLKSMLIKYIAFISTSFIFFVNSSYSEDAQEIIEGYSVGGCAKKMMGIKCLNKTHFNFSGFMLGDSTFSDIRNVFGNAEIYKKKNSKKIFLCYQQKTIKGALFVEFGGYPSNVGLSIVSSMLVKQEKSYSIISSCRYFKVLDKNTIPESGLKMGIEKNKFSKLIFGMGRPVKDVFSFSGGYINKNKTDFVNQGLRSKFINNKLITLYFGMSEEPL